MEKDFERRRDIIKELTELQLSNRQNKQHQTKSNDGELHFLPNLIKHRMDHALSLL
jgi:hypothetical protein